MKFLSAFLVALVASVGVTNCEAKTGYWELQGSRLMKLAPTSSNSETFIVRKNEGDVVFELKNTTFRRPDSSGRYSHLPIGYDMYFRFTWTKPKSRVLPGEVISTELGLQLLKDSKNPQDANLDASSRVFFVDPTNKKTNAAPYQIPYSKEGDWRSTANSSVFGPKVSWSDGNRAKHQSVVIASGGASKNTYGKQTHMGVLINMSSFGYWLYDYRWVDAN